MILKDLKVNIILLFAIISFVITGFSAFVCTHADIKHLGLIIGIIFMILALILHIMAVNIKPQLHIFSICSNAIGTGFSIGSYYSCKSIFLPLFTVIITIFSSLFLLYVCYCILLKARSKVRSCLLILLLFLILTTLCILCWNKTTIASYALFQLIMVFFYDLLGAKALNKPSNLLKDISSFSFGIYLALLLVVVTLIYDGVFLDYFIDISERKKRKRDKH